MIMAPGIYLNLIELILESSYKITLCAILTCRNLDDAKPRALENLGRVYARMGKFEKAIEV